MYQSSTTKIELRTKVLNIGCMGRVTIEVHADGWWEIMLESNRDNNKYFRNRGTMLPDNQLFCHSEMIVAELPDWMFKQFHDTIDELLVEFERDALDVPQYRQELPV